jgi:diguanylate cyclase (GGDEF)-like protein
MTPQSPLRAFVLTGDPVMAGSLESLLQLACPATSLRRAQTVPGAIAVLATEPADCVFVDLAMLDAGDLIEVTRPIGAEPPTVFAVLRQDCPLRTAEAIQAGAQECIVLGDLTPDRLARSLRQGLVRQRLQSRLADLALRDELTGLYNRRGFFALADHQRRQCLRNGRSLVVVQADVDRLKEINDRFGHRAGDQAIGNTAAVLRCTFRESDIVARLGGDEFAAVAVDADETAAARIVARVTRALDEQNSREGLPYRLSLSVGTAVLAPPSRTTLADLLAEADRALYQAKRTARPLWPAVAAAAVARPTIAA